MQLLAIRSLVVTPSWAAAFLSGVNMFSLSKSRLQPLQQSNNFTLNLPVSMTVRADGFFVPMGGWRLVQVVSHLSSNGRRDWLLTPNWRSGTDTDHPS